MHIYIKSIFEFCAFVFKQSFRKYTRCVDELRTSMLSIDYNTPICLPELIQQSDQPARKPNNRVFFYSSFTDASHEADFCAHCLSRTITFT